MSSRHWSGSAPFEYLRSLFGFKKPTALQWGEWDDWEKKTKAEHPIGWWMTEKLPDYLERVPETFVDPFYAISYYIRNRWHRQTHVLPTGFKPGTYHDLSERLLHGMMQSLVDFVEVEKAWMQYIFHDDKVKLGRGGRSIEAGMAHLNWESTLDSPELEVHERSNQQAETARETIALYDWWKNIRPNRPDPYDATGWSDFCDEQIGEILDERIERSEEYHTKSREITQKMREMEDAYNNEDEQMLMRLVKIRLHLWT